MWQLVSASLRHHGRRYVATIVAVTIAVTFVAASLVLGSTLMTIIKNEVAGQYNGAAAVLERDYSVEGEDDSLTRAEKIAANVSGVSETFPIAFYGFEIASSDPNHSWISSGVFGQENLGVPELLEGRAPNAAYEAVVTENAANRLSLEVGSTLDVKSRVFVEDTGEDKETVETLTITGIALSESQSVFVTLSSDLLIGSETMSLLAPFWQPEQVLVASGSQVPSDAAQQELVDELNAALKAEGINDVKAATAYSKIDSELAALNSTQAQLTVMVLVFPVIAATVALIVVGTTFQVIFRQRQRELALLRVIGATGSQVRWMMRAESAAVGLIGAILGIAIGTFGGAAIATGLGLLRNYGQALGSISWTQTAIILVVATLLTTLAGNRPARVASTVSPISALAGNVDTVQQMSQKQKIFGIISGALTLGLGGLTAYLAVTSPADDNGERFLVVLLLAVLTAGALIVLLASVLPLITRAAGGLGKSVSYRLAAANTARNPGRTAATGIAVFIGVTLISMVTVGAESLRVTSTTTLDRTSPIDLIVGAPTDGFTETQLSGLKDLEGIESTAVLQGAPADLTVISSIDGTWTSSGYAILAPTSTDVIRGEFEAPGPGQVIVPFLSPEDVGSPVELCVSETCLELEGIAVGSVAGSDRFIISEETAAKFAETTPWTASQVWLKLENPDDYPTVVADIQDLGSDFYIDGTVGMRAAIETIVNVLVMVIVALLAVSVLVALVGITNTLSLSVAERVKENGLLRAMGMTKTQVSNMLKWESLLIGVTASLSGLAAGAFFGIVGFFALPLGEMELVIGIPWLQWLAIVVTAILASLLASIVPGRRASRVSPVAALAAD